MFSLTLFYYKLYNKRDQTKSIDLTNYINVKKGLSVILSVLLLGLSVYSLAMWAIQVSHAHINLLDFPNPNLVFYKDFFSVMIFTDVFLLILSFVYFKSYDVIFRNAGFIISTILIRIALAADKPFNVYISILAMLFGVLLLLLYLLYNNRISFFAKRN